MTGSPLASSRAGGGPSRRADRLWLAGMLLVAALYLGAYLMRGWYPHDEGALGQTAERVLAGEVPHRDFDEPYTGLLTYLHAAAFAVGGIRLPVLRVPLFLATLVWLTAVFRIARRSAGPAAAAAIGLVALAWSVPNYPASMPSWYNLFCATFGILALLRWEESRRARWLVLAGVAGGVSFLFKLSGLFFVIGALLFLLYATRSERNRAERRDPVGILLAGAITLGLAALIAVLWRAVAPYHWPRVIYHFVAPGSAIAIALMLREWRPPLTPGVERAGALLRAALPFLAGFALPVGIFALGFAVAGALPALINGVFVAPFRRLAFANMLPPAPFWVLAAAPLAILLRPRPDPEHPKWRRAAAIVAVLLAAVLYLALLDSFPHRFVWQSLRGLIPLTALVAAGIIAWPSLVAAWAERARLRFVLLAMVTSFASLIQFPFSAPIYFLYVAPLLLLALVALVQGFGRTPAPLAAVTLGLYGLFAVLLVNPGSMNGMGFQAQHWPAAVPLDLPRGGIRVPTEDAGLYRELVTQLTAHAGEGPVWAGPDAPEVYFLSGFRNRSRALFDFLGDRPAAEFLGSLEGTRAIVLNSAPPFSPRLPAALVDSLRVRFPEGRTVGRFELRWRN